MVLELIADPAAAARHPGRTVLLGFLYSCVAIVLSLWIFRQSASLVAVFLTVIAAFPVFYDTIRRLERKEEQHGSGRLLWREHSAAVQGLFYLFLGVMVAFAVWYTLVPSAHLETLFSSQTQAISGVQGFATAPFAGDRMGFFAEVLLNNLSILLFCVLFSFLYGAGAVFILIWNASVIGVAVGNFIRMGVAQAAQMLGAGGAYFHVVSLGILRYALHGIPEVIAYLIASLAGGIISMGLYRSRGNLHATKELLSDALELTGAAIILLVISAWIEAFVSTAVL